MVRGSVRAAELPTQRITCGLFFLYMVSPRSAARRLAPHAHDSRGKIHLRAWHAHKCCAARHPLSTPNCAAASRAASAPFTLPFSVSGAATDGSLGTVHIAQKNQNFFGTAEQFLYVAILAYLSRAEAVLSCAAALGTDFAPSMAS